MRWLFPIPRKANPAFTNLTYKFTGYGLAFGASAYAAQRIGPTHFGFITLAIFTQYLLCEVADLGFSTHIARQIAKSGHTFHSWLSHIPRIFFRSLLAMGIWIVGISLFTDSLKSTDLVLALNIPFWMANSYFQQVAYAKGLLNLANLELFLQNSLLLAVMPLSYFTTYFYEMGIVFASFVSFLFSIISSIMYKVGNEISNFSRFPKFDFNIFQNQGIRLAASRIIGLATYMDTLVIGALLGPVVAGYYALASRMRPVLPAGLISISDSTYYRAIATKQISEIFQALGNKIIVGLTLAISGLMFVKIDTLVLLIFGSEYSASTIYFRFFIVISLIIGFIYILKNLLVAWHEDLHIRRHVYRAAFIQGFLTLILILLDVNYAIPIALLISNLYQVFAFGARVQHIRNRT